MNRREALAALLASVLAPGCLGTRRAGGQLLPPTAGPGSSFLSRCIRCFRCGEVCTAGCIEFHPPWAGKLAGSPYLVAREVGCNTCMACTQVCPTGALSPVDRDNVEEVLAKVDMGTAYVDESICLSHQGRVCGVCHDACPFPGKAIVLAPGAQPEVLDACVGCGRCEERCPQVPAAIRVTPAGEAHPGPRWVGPENA
jgi:ferredoxin-type protein NapG